MPFKIAIAANAGFIIGTIRLKKIPYSVAPSILPASINDLGIPFKYCIKKKILTIILTNSIEVSIMKRINMEKPRMTKNEVKEKI